MHVQAHVPADTRPPTVTVAIARLALPRIAPQLERAVATNRAASRSIRSPLDSHPLKHTESDSAFSDRRLDDGQTRQGSDGSAHLEAGGWSCRREEVKWGDARRRTCVKHLAASGPRTKHAGLFAHMDASASQALSKCSTRAQASLSP